MIIIANIFGLISLIINIYMYQANTKKDLLLRQIFYTFFMLMEFIFLKAYIALYVGLISFIRSLVFYVFNNKNKGVSKSFIIILIILFIIPLIYNYQNIMSFIPVIIGISYTLSLQIKDVNKIKKICIVLAILWIVYYLFIKAYISILARLFDIGSILVSFARIKKDFKKQ